ncbi:hypothetical protein [Calothrix sp. NIES-2098]|uniref:hypothetical protein n=1 Tax=Calothrix sp. NIES-2098 TaxID=1954171 RepID=UPI000B600A53|nr:hypothetical protein NIES2098_16870 [Calothrix sp. NIES-2098]
MDINIQIDRLILEDINISPSQRRHLQSTVESELSSLFTANGLPSHLHNGAAFPSLPLGKVEVTNTTDTTVMGQQIAQQIYSQLIQ